MCEGGKNNEEGRKFYAPSFITFATRLAST